MKPGRNDLCPCGSGKKYKLCCLNITSKQHAEVFDDIAQVVAMNPTLILNELNAIHIHRLSPPR